MQFTNYLENMWWSETAGKYFQWRLGNPECRAGFPGTDNCGQDPVQIEPTCTCIEIVKKIRPSYVKPSSLKKKKNFESKNANFHTTIGYYCLLIS